MGLFDNRKYVGTRLIADSVKLCKITDWHKVDGKPTNDGSCPRDSDWFTFALQEEALDTNGQVLPVGFTKEVAFSSYAKTDGDSAKETTNRISNDRMFELVTAALDIPRNCKDVPAEVDKLGGAEALKGRPVRVEWQVRGDNQNIKHFFPPEEKK